MKKMKKLLCIILCLIMVCGMTASASDSDADTRKETYVNLVRAVVGPAPKAKLTNNNINTSSRTFRVAWNRIKGVSAYEVQRSTDRTFPEDSTKSSIIKDTAIKYHIFSPVGIYYFPAHQTYYVRVRAKFSTFNGRWSNTVVSKGDPDTK